MASRAYLAAVLAGLAGACADGPAMTQASAPLPQGVEGARWTLVFADEFEGQALDTATWHVEDSAPGHITSVRGPDNIAVTDGFLHLITRARDGAEDGRRWSTAHVWTRRSFGDGVFEARLRLAPEAGMNNAFWLFPVRHPNQLGLTVGQTVCELDVIEATHPDRMTYNLHVFEQTGTGDLTRDIYRMTNPWRGAAPNSADFMTLSIERDGGTLIWRQDGEVVRSAEAPCTGPLTVRLSTATASWLGEPPAGLNGQAMLIDYVRVWERP